ncbi:MAG: hypothetical protein LBI91_08170 [Spirochaetaceae bacterium]|jgi:hypothetical protein|nr:hypothetical protein [Spirochaetaceae bacterium]
MKALLLGLVFILAAVLAIIPAGLGWSGDVLAFLRGAAPVIAVLIGIIAVFIGIADIKDRAEAKKEDTPEEKPKDAE